MSSGFVSSGQLDSSEPRKVEQDTDNGSPRELTGVDAWAAADAAVKAAEDAASASGLMGSQEGGKTLYDVLQANKARKQEEFEEKLKFKNQFRSLDEGEIEFLDSVISEQRAAEEAKKKELEAQLDDFRRLQYEADHDPNAVEPAIQEEISSGTWAISGRRKRKKDKDAATSGLKLRKMSDGTRQEITAKVDEKDPRTPAEDTPSVETKLQKSNSSTAASPPQNTTAAPDTKGKTPVASVSKPAAGLSGLVAYGSDSDDD
ncbi:hypothetical protein ABW21_db0208178 [Orbilia brochopaga]|nr:hypothetical protein ABW21_db0208178 [Drechslerella brochopaga]